MPGEGSMLVGEEEASELTDLIVWLPQKRTGKEDARIRSIPRSSWKKKSNTLDTGVKNLQQMEY